MKLKLKELKTGLGTFKDLEISLGRVEDESWEEPAGPHPYPSITDLRQWDRTLLKRYKPFYMPFCDLCCLCTYGKCDLTAGKRGACGLDIFGQQSRIVLLAACIGCSTHAAHAREMVDHLMEKLGRGYRLDAGGSVEIEAPITRLVCGVRPQTLSDLEEVLEYIENQVTQLLAVTHTGQEGDPLDFESKVFHAGMLDHVALEVADIAQISGYNFPKSEPDAPLADIGSASIDTGKPVVLCVGHNVASGVEVMDYLAANRLSGKVEACGLCCTALDLTRYDQSAKIVGPMSWQLRFLRSGIPDVIMVDEQCVRADTLQEARRIGAPVIAASNKISYGLPDRTQDAADSIVDDLIHKKIPGAAILDPELAAEVAVKTALQVAPTRSSMKKPLTMEDVMKEAEECTQCKECLRACPHGLDVESAVQTARDGDLSKLAEIYHKCIACGRCEEACKSHLPLVKMFLRAAEPAVKDERFRVRVGRGAIQDTEIREVGAPIVLGEIPGVIAFVGCPNYPRGPDDLTEMAEQLLRRNYIVTTSGCSAMTIGMRRGEENKSLYEQYPGSFSAGGLVNVGSCVSNSHIAGAAIKIASIFAKRKLRGNYEEIADYILNRVGAVGIAWGAMSQKAASIASGCWRLGIPVIVGPHGIKYRRMLLGRKEKKEDWMVYDARSGEKVYVGPAPEHLFYVAETKEEAIVMAAKLCIRANDTSKGRQIKLSNYIDLHRRYYGRMPDDIHLLVRTVADVPITMKEDILKILEEKGWEESVIPDPTLIPRLIRRKVE